MYSRVGRLDRGDPENYRRHHGRRVPAWGSLPASGGYGLALCIQTILEALGVALVLCRGSGALD